MMLPSTDILTPSRSSLFRIFVRWLNNGLPEFMLILVAAIWGGSYCATKLATHELPVLIFLSVRFGITFLLLSPALRPLYGMEWRRNLVVSLPSGLNLLLIFLAETFGVTLTSAANAAFLISLCIAFTPIVERVWFKKPIPKPIMAAVFISVFGAGLLSLNSASTLSLGWGDGLILAAAILRAVMVCLIKRSSSYQRLPALTLTAVQAGVVACGSFLILCFTSLSGSVSLPVIFMKLAYQGINFWAEMGFLVVFCTIFAFFAQNYAASRTSPSRVALLMGSEPAFGAVFAVVWLGESVSYTGWIGGALIVGATCVTSLLNTGRH